jgi:hypothetical protein
VLSPFLLSGCNVHTDIIETVQEAVGIKEGLSAWQQPIE